MISSVRFCFIIILMLITALGPILRGVQRLKKEPDNTKLAQDVLAQTRNTRDLAHKLSLDPLNLLTTPIERIMTSLETFDHKFPLLMKRNPNQALLIKDISQNLFEAIVLAILNRIKIMEKLPEMKNRLEAIFNKEDDEGLKHSVELIEELRGIQVIKWKKDGYTALDSFAARDRGVRSVFGKNFNSWNDFLEASRDKFNNILSPEFLHQFRKAEASNEIVKFARNDEPKSKIVKFARKSLAV